MMPIRVGIIPRTDVHSDATELIREIVPLPSEGVVFNGRRPHFEYYESTHPNLLAQIDWLEDMGLVIDVTRGNTPVYRMRPEFVRWLRGRR